MGTSQVFPFAGEKEEAVMQSVFSEDFCIGKASQSGKLGFFPRNADCFRETSFIRSFISTTTSLTRCNIGIYNIFNMNKL